jgi:tetratricopeptide (TPR) repeat protein
VKRLKVDRLMRAGEWIWSVAISFLLATVVAAGAPVQAQQTDVPAADREQATRYLKEKSDDLASQREHIRKMKAIANKVSSDEPIGKGLRSLLDLMEKQASCAEVALHAQQLVMTQKSVRHPETRNVPDDRVLADRESRADRSDGTIEGIELNDLARQYAGRGRFADAEPLYKRSLVLLDRLVGPEHPDVALTLSNLADLYMEQGRYGEAEPLLKRSLAIREKALGAYHQDVGLSISGLAELYRIQGRISEAMPLYERNLELALTLGSDNPNAGISILQIGTLCRDLGNGSDGEPLFQLGLAMLKRAVPPDHPILGRAFIAQGKLYLASLDFWSATESFQRALSIVRKVSSRTDHPDESEALDGLASVHYLLKQWPQATMFWRQSTDLLIRRIERGTSEGQGEVVRLNERFFSLLRSAQHLASIEPNNGPALGREIFRTVQWVLGSRAAESLAQMAVRVSKPDPEIAALVRKSQDLIAERRNVDAVLTAAFSRIPAKRDQQSEAANAARLGIIDSQSPRSKNA